MVGHITYCIHELWIYIHKNIIHDTRYRMLLDFDTNAVECVFEQCHNNLIHNTYRGSEPECKLLDLSASDHSVY